MRRYRFTFIALLFISLPSYSQECFIDIPVLLEVRLEINDSKIKQDLKSDLNKIGAKINCGAKQLNNKNSVTIDLLIDSYILYAREYLKKKPDSYTIEKTIENMVEIITDDEFFNLIEKINNQY